MTTTSVNDGDLMISKAQWVGWVAEEIPTFSALRS